VTAQRVRTSRGWFVSTPVWRSARGVLTFSDAMTGEKGKSAPALAPRELTVDRLTVGSDELAVFSLPLAVPAVVRGLTTAQRPCPPFAWLDLSPRASSYYLRVAFPDSFALLSLNTRVTPTRATETLPCRHLMD